jgi:hypothetical protein
MATATPEQDGTLKDSRALAVPAYLARYEAEVDAWHHKALAYRFARTWRDADGGAR